MCKKSLSTVQDSENLKPTHLRPVDLLLPDGHLVPEDGPVVLDHHRLFFNVPGSEQPQTLRKDFSGLTADRRPATTDETKADYSPGCVSGPGTRWLSTHSSSSGTEKTWGALPEACCGGQHCLLGPRSGWTWQCLRKQPEPGVCAAEGDWFTNSVLPHSQPQQPSLKLFFFFFGGDRGVYVCVTVNV